MNTIRVSANTESASVEGKNFKADIEPDYCVMELKNVTIFIDRQKEIEQIENLETTLELLKGIWNLD